jgi:hypothetical protein
MIRLHFLCEERICLICGVRVQHLSSGAYSALMELDQVDGIRQPHSCRAEKLTEWRRQERFRRLWRGGRTRPPGPPPGGTAS